MSAIWKQHFSWKEEKGTRILYSEASKYLNHPNVWLFYFMGQPVVSVSGSELVNDVLSREFDTLGTLPNDSKQDRVAIFGRNNVMFERNPEKHAFLRRLVGSGNEIASKPFDRLNKRQMKASLNCCNNLDR
jgi:cytochrome P450